MKKILAVLLSVTMLFALCVPSFATDKEITQSTDQSGTGDVKVTYQPTDYAYSVSFPAETTFTWGETAQKDISYKVNYQLLAGASLKVSVAVPNEMTSTETSDKLTLTAKGDTAAKEFKGSIAKTATAGPESPIQIQVASYDAKTIANYTAQITYTVTYTAPTV